MCSLNFITINNTVNKWILTFNHRKLYNTYTIIRWWFLGICAYNKLFNQWKLLFLFAGILKHHKLWFYLIICVKYFNSREKLFFVLKLPCRLEVDMKNSIDLKHCAVIHKYSSFFFTNFEVLRTFGKGICNLKTTK